jgi:hypothetical protein
MIAAAIPSSFTQVFWAYVVELCASEGGLHLIWCLALLTVLKGCHQCESNHSISFSLQIRFGLELYCEAVDACICYVRGLCEI